MLCIENHCLGFMETLLIRCTCTIQPMMKTLIALSKDTGNDGFELMADVQCQNKKVEKLLFFSINAFLQWLILCGNIPIPDVLPKTLSALKTDFAQIQNRFQRENYQLYAAHCSQWLRSTHQICRQRVLNNTVLFPCNHWDKHG